MQTSDRTYPTAIPGDSSAVVTALQAGSAEWGKGDMREAVRWLHRAASAAEAAGEEDRALGLARTAAEFMRVFSIPEQEAVAPVVDEAAALAPFDDANDQTIVDSPAVLASRTAQSSSTSSLRRIEDGPELPPKAPLKPPRPSPSSPKTSPKPGAPRARRALRVAVVTDPRNERLILATTLDEGAPVPSGSKEALLVLLDPDARLLSE